MRRKTLQERIDDMIGKTFGEITVLSYDHMNDRRELYFKCRCNHCDSEFVTKQYSLTSGHTKSCGCVRTEWMHSGNLNKKHGLYEDRAYWLWAKVKARCYNKNSREYKNYGGRGITMCEEWLNPQNFVEWAYANGYDKDAPKGQCTLDRIDVDGNYEPSNCRFITNLEQQNNRRDCNFFEYNGERHTVAEWARIFDVPYVTLQAGLIRYHKPIEYYATEYKRRKK